MSDCIVIILNWNKPYLTLQAVDSVIENEPGVDILVIDNGSDSSSYAELKKLLTNKRDFLEIDLSSQEKEYKINPMKLLLRLEENLGYAKGNNIGLRLASKWGYRYAIIMNNDVILEQPVVTELKKHLELRSDVAVIGPKILGQKNELQGPYEEASMFVFFWSRLFYPALYPYLKIRRKKFIRKYSKKGLFVVYGIPGSFMMVKLDLLSRVEFFDESTFLFAEEVILAEKLKKVEYKIAYYSGVYVRHLYGQTTSIWSKRKRDKLVFESAKYYLREYKGYGSLKLFLVNTAFYVWEYLWVPVIRLTKKILKRN